MTTNEYGKFDTWLKNTYVLIDMIKSLNGSMVQKIITFTSPQFSFDYDNSNGQTTFKFNVLSEIEDIKDIKINSPGVATHFYPSAPNAILSSSVYAKNVDQIIINCSSGAYRINYIKWVRRTGSGIAVLNTSEFNSFNYLDGSLVRNTFLFLPENGIMVDGVIYRSNSSEAFTNDISGDDNIKYLDLLHFREKFNEGIFS